MIIYDSDMDNEQKYRYSLCIILLIALAFEVKRSPQFPNRKKKMKSDGVCLC